MVPPVVPLSFDRATAVPGALSGKVFRRYGMYFPLAFVAVLMVILGASATASGDLGPAVLLFAVASASLVAGVWLARGDSRLDAARTVR